MLLKKKDQDWMLKVFDSLSYPTRILNPDGTIVAVNKKFIDTIESDVNYMVGHKCNETNGNHLFLQQFPCNGGIDCPLKKAVSTKKGQSIVFNTTDPEGNEKWEDRVFSPIMDDAGNVIYIIESMRDITKAKKLEKMFSGIQNLIDNVVQSSNSSIIAANRKGNIILMNEAAEKLFCLTAEEANHLNIEDFYQSGVARDIMKKLRDPSLGEKGKLPITKVNIVTRHGEVVPVEMTATIIYEDGEESATAAIFNDLREKLAVEKKLREAQSQVVQTEKMASLGRLAAGVAHEINNPLTSIVLYGNIIREKLEEDSSMQKKLRYILEDAERCKDIVKNLLAYSRQTAPKNDIFLINTLVEESLSLIRDQKLFVHIEVVMDLADQPIYVSADKNQLIQVVINLIINAIDAIDAIDGKGFLRFRTSEDPRSGKAYLEVEDSGSGIPEEYLAKVFDPFFTTKASGKGTGLGLSMAYGVLEENKGKISVKKTGPEGTTIMLQLQAVDTSSQKIIDTIG